MILSTINAVAGIDFKGSDNLKYTSLEKSIQKTVSSLKQMFGKQELLNEVQALLSKIVEIEGLKTPVLVESKLESIIKLVETDFTMKDLLQEVTRELIEEPSVARKRKTAPGI